MADLSYIAENILVSLLAVNTWTIDRVYALRDGLVAQGLTDFDAVSRLDVADVSARLVSGGYARGPYLTDLAAVRVLSLSEVLAGSGLERLGALIDAGDRDQADTLLRTIRGVGPYVLRNFWLLQNSES